jgi:hypothetical protein
MAHSQAHRIALPGVSQFDVVDVGDGASVVRCPGCCAEQVIPADTAAPAFAHADRGCPVLRAIEGALEAFREAVEVRA